MKKMTIISLILISLTGFAEEKKKEKKTLKQDINETADQIDSGTRKAIKEVKNLLKTKNGK